MIYFTLASKTYKAELVATYVSDTEAIRSEGGLERSGGVGVLNVRTADGRVNQGDYSTQGGGGRKAGIAANVGDADGKLDSSTCQSYGVAKWLLSL
jgi:hypothetical protein